MCANICEHGNHWNDECEECKRTLICSRCNDCYVDADDLKAGRCNGCDDTFYGHGSKKGIYENDGNLQLMSSIDRNSKDQVYFGFEAVENVWDIKKSNTIKVSLSKYGETGFSEDYEFDKLKLADFLEQAVKKLREKDYQPPVKLITCAECGEGFDLYSAQWCSDNQPTKLCPNGHCICDRKNTGTWKEASQEDKENGIFRVYIGNGN